MAKKVMVTGCFDLLHSGHVAFLQEAAGYGDLYVCIGSNSNILQLKGRNHVQPEAERKYMLEALGCVKQCLINSGTGVLDFVQELQMVQPDIFIVNEEGHSLQKQELCRTSGVDYLVLKRTPPAGLPPRSTSALRQESRIPYRIDLAGGWLDQPYVSKHHHGWVLTVAIEPDIVFNLRSGMATSTRNKALDLWNHEIPDGNREQLAKILFSYENPPGTDEIAGSQDALGIVMPGLNRYWYNGGYWPEKIEAFHDEAVLQWLEDHLYLVSLGPRAEGYKVLNNTNISPEGAARLSQAADDCWNALLRLDTAAFGRHFTASFEAQCAMFPDMKNAEVERLIEAYRDQTLGWKISGAGGGGYIIFVATEPLPNATKIQIRRKDAL